MATTTINKTKINTVSFANAPQANGDNYSFTEQQLLDSSMFSFDGTSSILTLDVMSNDLGGAAKTLYSVDEGTTTFMQDLLTSNITTGWEPTSGGNMMRIVNGKIELDITNALNLQAGGNLNSLGVDDTISDSFVYSIRMSNGTLSWARVTFNVTGQNDGPTVEGAIEIGAQEDEAAFDVDLLAGASDADFGDVLGVSDVQGLEAGVTLDGTTLVVDPTSAAFQSLAVGEDKVITVTYNVTDEHGASVAQSATITITGTNDTPTVAAALTASADEDDAGFNVDLLAGAGDVDHDAALSVTDVTGLEDGVSVSGSTLTVDPANAAFQSLKDGEDKIITVNYNVTDEHGASVAQSATITITGTNDTPTVAAALTASADEDDAGFNVDLLAGAGDVDHDAALSVTDVTGLEDGVSVSGSTLTVDPANAAFQSLKDGEDKIITVTYNVTDEHGASVAQSATITITGTNDTPTVAAALTASADEDDEDDEDDAGFNVDLLAGAADVDHDAALSVTDVTGLEDGVSVSGSTLTVDPSDAAFQALELGEDKVITVTYNVTDEHGASVAQSATITITGTSDIPTVAAALTGAADEDDATFDVDLLAGAADVDHNAVLSVTDVAGLEAGVSITGSTLSVDPADAAFQSLELGEDKVITVTYNVTDEHGASVAQSATITITGTNDTPTVAAALTASADEDDAGFNVDLLAGAGDVDHDAALSVTDVTGLEDGVSVSGSTLTVDPANAAFQSLKDGEDKIITVNYNVTDEHGASVAQSATITITGTNDTPTVAAALTGAADEDDATFDIDLLAGAADVDHDAVLTVTDVAGLEAGVSVTNSTLSVDPADAAFQSLELGEDKVITVTYNVTDEHGASVAQSATITITGTNDIPTVAAALTGAADEDDATFDVDLLAGAADVDHNAVLSVTDVAGLEAGVSITGSTLSVDPADAAFQSLAAGATHQITVSYSVTDELGASVAQSATITITGTNDGPVIEAAHSAFDVSETLTETNAALSTSGRVVFSDVDTGDTPSASLYASSVLASGVTLTTAQSDAILAGFSITDAATGAWAYNLASPEYLNDGNTVTATFTVRVTDDSGAIVDQDVTVTLNGSTDAAPITDLAFTVTTPPSGNSVPSGAFGQISVPGGSGTYSYSLTTLTATTLGGAAVTDFAGDLTVSGSGSVTGTNVNTDRVYSMTVQATQGANTYAETFRIITGTNAAETSLGGSGTGDDVLFAGGAGDIVLAGSGNDTVMGQAGDDKIYGGAGNDVLTGGSNNDTFYFDTAVNASTNVDHITDFSASSTDFIWLSKTVFSGLATAGSAGGTTLGAADYAEVATGGATANIGSAHIVYDVNTGNLYYDSDGGDSTSGRTLFAVLDNKPALADMDFSDFKVGT